MFLIHTVNQMYTSVNAHKKRQYKNVPVVEPISGAVEQVAGVEVAVAFFECILQQLLVTRGAVTVPVEATLHGLVVYQVHDQTNL